MSCLLHDVFDFVSLCPHVGAGLAQPQGALQEASRQAGGSQEAEAREGWRLKQQQRRDLANADHMIPSDLDKKKKKRSYAWLVGRLLGGRTPATAPHLEGEATTGLNAQPCALYCGVKQLKVRGHLAH